MTANVYTNVERKPFIRSLKTAQIFLEEITQPLFVDLKNGIWYQIRNGAVVLMQTREEEGLRIHAEREKLTGEDAARQIYQLRKILNAKFAG